MEDRPDVPKHQVHHSCVRLDNRALAKFKNNFKLRKMQDQLIAEADQSPESKSAALKQTTKSFWASSRGKILLVWTLTATIIAVVYAMMPNGDVQALEQTFLLSTLLGKFSHLSDKEFFVASFASTATVLIRYASPDTFDWSAYVIHGTTFLFSFSMLGLLATDLAFTLRNRELGDIEN